MPKQYSVFCPLYTYFGDTCSWCTSLSHACCVIPCHAPNIVINYPWHLNFLFKLQTHYMQVSVRCFFIFVSCNIVAVRPLLGLADSGKVWVTWFLPERKPGFATEWYLLYPLFATCSKSPPLSNIPSLQWQLYVLSYVTFLFSFFSSPQFVSSLNRNSLLLWMVN